MSPVNWAKHDIPGELEAIFFANEVGEFRGNVVWGEVISAKIRGLGCTLVSFQHLDVG